MDDSLPATSLAEILARRIAMLDPARLPATVRRKCEDLAVDVVGLCLTARNEDYVKAALAGWDEEGACTAIGHARPMSAAGAAFVNGTAAHGEDFDDTFEGGPVHAGAVIVPAVLTSRATLKTSVSPGSMLWRHTSGSTSAIPPSESASRVVVRCTKSASSG